MEDVVVGLAEADDDEVEDGFEIPGDDSIEFRRQGMPRSLTGRAKTLSTKHMTLREVRAAKAAADPDEFGPRPKTRAECKEEERPCPYVGCKFHLYLDVNPETGSIKINFPHLEPWELAATCALDVSERGGVTLEEVGQIMNLTRERVRQVEAKGLLKLKLSSPSEDELGASVLPARDLVQIRRRK